MVVNLILDFHAGRSISRLIYPFLIYAYILHSFQFHSRNLASLALNLSGGKSWSVPDIKQSHTYTACQENATHIVPFPASVSSNPTLSSGFFSMSPLS